MALSLGKVMLLNGPQKVNHWLLWDLHKLVGDLCLVVGPNSEWMYTLFLYDKIDPNEVQKRLGYTA